MVFTKPFNDFGLALWNDDKTHFDHNQGQYHNYDEKN